MRPRRWGWLLVLGIGWTFLLSAAPGVDAQQIPMPGGGTFFPADSTGLAPEPEAAEPVTPGGAFLRSLLLPGWGHAATGSVTRGGFYVAAQAGGLWMLGTSLLRRGEARDFARMEREVVRARLMASGTTEPNELQLAIEEDPAILQREALVASRDQQVEDWIAFSAFTLLLGAADAYVAAHLADYPEPLALRVLPAGVLGVQVGLAIPIGGR